MKGLATPAAIIIGATIIAGAMLYLARWDIRSGATGGVYLVNRWTGVVYVCDPQPDQHGLQQRFGKVCPDTLPD